MMYRLVWSLSMFTIVHTAVGCATDLAPTSRDAASDTTARAQPDIASGAEPDTHEYPLVLEGPQVTPQTELHLDGKVGACGHDAATFQWTVIQPQGSQGVFKPSSTHPTPTVVANVVGDYRFELQTYNFNGQPCDHISHYTVSVLPTTALHVELTWTTPGDPDETDTGPAAGSDLDLHFYQHLSGPPEQTWFDSFADCYWLNPNPNWGDASPTADDDPSLDRDDTDGAGPENLSLNHAEPGAEFGVMVHYWSSHGFGESSAQVRVYWHGELAYESLPVTLQQLDGWDVGTFSWATGEFFPTTDDAGGPVILSGLENPLLTEP